MVNKNRGQTVWIQIRHLIKPCLICIYTVSNFKIYGFSALRVNQLKGRCSFNHSSLPGQLSPLLPTLQSHSVASSLKLWNRISLLTCTYTPPYFFNHFYKGKQFCFLRWNFFNHFYKGTQFCFLRWNFFNHFYKGTQFCFLRWNFFNHFYKGTQFCFLRWNNSSKLFPLVNMTESVPIHINVTESNKVRLICYKKTFRLNSAEHESFPAHKC